MLGRVELEAQEKKALRKGAALSSAEALAHRIHPQEPDLFRTAFQRDYTRIIHCRAFRRLRHKTQVFISPKNDHLCTRLEHSLHVASVAATIARAMSLNVDLVQAIAVGHDLGHAPFGHTGEKALRRLAERNGLSFSHELQSLRVVDMLDSPYKGHRGLNLTFAVRDGIVSHCGERFEQELVPDRSKDEEALSQTVQGKSRPATLEGCVVRWADKIAYLGRDLDDAVEIKLIDRDHLPPMVKQHLGVENREIISRLIQDLTKESTSRCLRVSGPVHQALNELFEFNMRRIYRSPQARASLSQIDRTMRPLFALVYRKARASQKRKSLDAIAGRRMTDCPEVLLVLQDFLENDVRNWEGENAAQLAIDFIAGMTDSYFMRAVNDLFFPSAVV